MSDNLSSKPYDNWRINPTVICQSGELLVDYIQSSQSDFRIGDYGKVQRNLKATILKEQNSIEGNLSPYCLAILLLWNGIVCRKLGRLGDSRRSLLKSARVLSSLGETENLARAYLCLGDTHRARVILNRRRPNLSPAGYWYKRARAELSSILNEKSVDEIASLFVVQLIWAKNKMALLRSDLQQHDLSLLWTAWRISCRYHSEWAKEETAQLIGKYYMRSNNYIEAHRWYRISLGISSRTGNVDRYLEAVKLLVENAINLGKFDRDGFWQVGIDGLKIAYKTFLRGSGLNSQVTNLGKHIATLLCRQLKRSG